MREMEHVTQRKFEAAVEEKADEVLERIDVESIIETKVEKRLHEAVSSSVSVEDGSHSAVQPIERDEEDNDTQKYSI